MGLVVVVLELSCPRACGTSAPRTGIELESPAVQGRFLTTGPPGKSHAFTPERHVLTRCPFMSNNVKAIGELDA